MNLGDLGRAVLSCTRICYTYNKQLFNSILASTQQVRSRETEKVQQMSGDVDFALISEVPLSSGCPGDVDITTSGDAAGLSMI